MNQLQIIDQREMLGKNFRIYGDYENPLFLAKDIAEWIEHSDVSTMLRGVDDSEKLTQTLFVSGQNREAWFLTEDGLYEVLMQSRKPIAKQFKAEVKKVLISIRKHGAYMTPAKIEELLLNPDSMIKVLTALKDEQSKTKALEEAIEKDKPKVLFADAVSASENTILIGELAKLLKGNGIEIGQNRLFEQLRQDGYLIKRKGTDYNMPTQRAMELGLFKVKETAINHSDGHVTVSKTPKVTGKGQQYFIDMFLRKKESA